jgi:hypothetical protein
VLSALGGWQVQRRQQTCVTIVLNCPPNQTAILCGTGGFPFLTAGEEAANPQRKMRYMLPRILAGDFLPLPNPVRPHISHPTIQEVAHTVPCILADCSQALPWLGRTWPDPPESVINSQRLCWRMDSRRLQSSSSL